VAADAQAAESAAAARAAVGLVVRQVHGDAGERDVPMVVKRAAGAVASGASVASEALATVVAGPAHAAGAAAAAMPTVTGPPPALATGAPMGFFCAEGACGIRLSLISRPDENCAAYGVEHPAAAACAADVRVPTVAPLSLATLAASASVGAGPTEASGGISAV